jgi:ABC-type Mn2+/Zn2+ transport system permease subunit
MLTFSLAASAFGGAAAFFGFYLAYRADLPLGPTQVALAAAMLVVVSGATALGRTLRRPKPA